MTSDSNDCMLAKTTNLIESKTQPKPEVKAKVKVEVKFKTQKDNSSKIK